MGKKILMMLALLGVSVAIVTCGEGSSVSSSSEYHIASDGQVGEFPCDVSEDGRIAFIQESNEKIVCRYDEYLDDWAWIPIK